MNKILFDWEIDKGHSVRRNHRWVVAKVFKKFGNTDVVPNEIFYPKIYLHTIFEKEKIPKIYAKYKIELDLTFLKSDHEAKEHIDKLLIEFGCKFASNKTRIFI